MVRNQDDASFLSWTATLHPESAFRTANIHPNRLSTQNLFVAVYPEISADDITATADEEKDEK